MRKTKKAGHPAWTWMAAAAVLGFAQISAGAADPALIRPDGKGSISLKLYEEESGSAVSDGVLTLYEAASLEVQDQDIVYTYTPSFADCTISLADVSQASLAEELDAWVKDHAVSGTAELSPDADGCLVFSDLPLGLYLIRQTVTSTGYEQILPFLVTLPFPEGETWIYDVDAGPKIRLLREESETWTEVELETPKETETEAETETETETETKTEGPSVPAGQAPGGSPRAARTGDTTPAAGMLGLLFAGAALIAVLAGYRCRTRRG